jgi:hypothetical protein
MINYSWLLMNSSRDTLSVFKVANDATTVSDDTVEVSALLVIVPFFATNPASAYKVFLPCTAS